MKTKCPTCNAPAKMTWSGLELVANTGDETLAEKHYQYCPPYKEGNFRAEWNDSDWWTIFYTKDGNSKAEIWLCIEGEESDTKAKQIADAFNMMIAINAEPTCEG